jgi:hypothetical protein
MSEATPAAFRAGSQVASDATATTATATAMTTPNARRRSSQQPWCDPEDPECGPAERQPYEEPHRHIAVRTLELLEERASTQ